MLILAGPVSSSLCHCASRSMQPLVSNGVEGALSLVHMPGPALHLDPYLRHNGFNLLPASHDVRVLSFQCDHVLWVVL